MNTGESALREYWLDKTKTLGVLVALTAIGALPSIFFLSDRPTLRILLLGFGVLCVAFALFVGQHVFRNRPVLTTSRFGLRFFLLAKTPIPWAAIASIDRVRFGNFEILQFVLRPTLLRRRSLLSAPLSLFSGDSDAMTSQILSAWEAGRINTAENPKAVDGPASTAKAPRLTYCLIGLFVLVYACELAFAVDKDLFFDPGAQTLADMGGIVGSRVWRDGEWWRLFTAPLLHANLIQAICDTALLWLVAAPLEKLIGWRLLAGIFALSGVFGALCGAVACIFVASPDVVVVDSNTWGVAFALRIIVYHWPYGLQEFQKRSFPMISFGMMATGPGMVHDIAEFSDLIGGVVAGGVFGFALLKLWPQYEEAPPFENPGLAIAVTFFIVAVGSMVPILRLHGVIG